MDRLRLKHVVVLIMSVCLFLPMQVKAHDIPSRITLQIYIHPQADQLNILMRVPMEAMGEIIFPTRGPGYLNFAELDSELESAVNVYLTEAISVFEDGVELDNQEISAIRVALPSDRSFVDYNSAYETVNSPPLTDSVDLLWQQAVLDVLMTFPINAQDSRFAIDSELSRLGLQTNTVLRFVLPQGNERVFNYFGNPGLIQLDPSLLQSLARFIVMGFWHILEGSDHLLFLFCLVIPLRSIRELIPVITAFTIAHSVTLIGSAFGLVPQALWFPPLIETLIALSIVYMALENILRAQVRHRWVVTYCFGLIHGFGFSFLLAETMQFAGGNLFSSLLAFNVGVELGQIMVLLITVPLLRLLLHYVSNIWITVILLSSLIAHSAWHWLLERWTTLMAYNFSWPVANANLFLASLRWGMLAIIAVGILWGMHELFRYTRILEASKPGNSYETKDYGIW